MTDRRLHAVPSLALWLLVTSGCGPSTSSVRGGDTGDVAISNPQGTRLQDVGGELEGFTAPTTGWRGADGPLALVAVREGALVVGPRAIARGRVGRPTSDPVRGATFTATTVDGRAVPMRIAGVRPRQHRAAGPRPTPGEREYEIEYQTGDGGWLPLCHDGGAVAIAGGFGVSARGRANGDYQTTSGELAFACPTGVAAKCIDWGYKPWLDDARYQACTRMARADYCGTGRSHTVDGTELNYGDLGPQPVQRFALLDGFEPEAIWGAGTGATGESAALCLSRTRWTTLPLGRRSPCADLMPDPREASTDGRPRRFCDDLTLPQWAAQGALFASASRPMDVGLFRWSDGHGHFITTSRHPWRGPDQRSVSPPGFDTFVDVEGPALLPTVDPAQWPGLVPLYTYTRTVDGKPQALTTTEPAAGDGYGDRVVQGYIFGPSATPPVSTAAKLKLYRHSEQAGVFATTADDAAPAGYELVTELGWLPH